MSKKILFLIIILLLLTTGCKKQEYEATINVLNWSSYIPDEVVRDFEKEYDIKVNYSTYSSNEELLAKVNAVKEGTYDLIFPSDYMVSIMKDRNLLDKIDKDKISNYRLIDKKYLSLDFDFNNEYSIPFLSATVVIATNKDLVSNKIDSYNDLLNYDFKDSIVVLDDTRILVGAALLANGYDMNSTNKEELKDAEDWLLRLKDNIKAFDSDSPKSFLITEEASIGLMWSAEAILAKEEKDNIEITIPKEGYNVSLDNFAILKGSKNKEAVYKFIDYILDSEVMTKIVESYPYSSVNMLTNSAMEKNPSYGKEYQRMQAAFSKGTRVKNIGEYISDYDKVWAYIK